MFLNQHLNGKNTDVIILHKMLKNVKICKNTDKALYLLALSVFTSDFRQIPIIAVFVQNDEIYVLTTIS